MSETVGQECIEATINLLSRYQGAPIEFERRDTSLVVKPLFDEGFEVAMYDEGDDVMIAAERWHSHYENPQEAAFAVLWLLTPYYRVVHELKGGVLVGAWLERYEPEGWMPFEPVYFLNPEDEKSWEPLPGEAFTRRYAQQTILMPPKDYDEIFPGVELDDEGLPPDSRFGSWTEEFQEALGPSLR